MLARRLSIVLMAAAIAACSTMTGSIKEVPVTNARFVAEFAAPGGYLYAEARQFVEFCVDLDSQDDRLNPKNSSTDLYVPRIDPALWEVAYDSRDAVARDYIDFRDGKSPAARSDNRPDDDPWYWKKLYGFITTHAAEKKIVIRTKDDVANNPDLNGFGPWQNAWVLYKGKGEFAGRYAIAIRGTVFSNAPSAIENAVFQPLAGRQFLSEKVFFALDKDATLHGGFAHATFTLLMDRRYGILQHILADEKDRVPATSTLYFVGHSQGAAMATLVHAFFFTEQYLAETTGSDPLLLKGRRFRLKSYTFAQPKPGDYAFAAEFARYTQEPDTAIVINNHIDPVPKVPLTLQSTSDLEGDFPGATVLSRVLRTVGGLGKFLRGMLSVALDDMTREDAAGYGNFYEWKTIGPLNSKKRESSWNFVPAGHVILVYGTPLTTPASDYFFQHHATTYRDLIAKQLSR
jgi:Lipase (class 3)